MNQLNRTKRLKILDYLKAICIWMVIIQHCEITILYGNTFLMPFWVKLAVPMFFMISGYTPTLYSERIGSMREYYLKLPVSIRTVVIPYLIASFLVFALRIISGSKYSGLKIFQMLLVGCLGTGGYFCIVYVMLLLVFPIFTYTIKKWKLGGLLLMIIINVVFELLVAAIAGNGMNIELFYKLCPIRYFAFAAWGLYLCLFDKRKSISQYLVCVGTAWYRLYPSNAILQC
ncbi:MAG: acyltransferase family protein [Lachnospiraceae bacterium]|nr:acyltransferase family protein [Lachnospiraceae bacterium]